MPALIESFISKYPLSARHKLSFTLWAITEFIYQYLHFTNSRVNCKDRIFFLFVQKKMIRFLKKNNCKPCEKTVCDKQSYRSGDNTTILDCCKHISLTNGSVMIGTDSTILLFLLTPSVFIINRQFHHSNITCLEKCTHIIFFKFSNTISQIICTFAGKSQILCITFGQTRVILQLYFMPISMVAFLYSRCITKRCSNDYLLLLKTSQRKRSSRNIIKQKQPRTTYTSGLRQRSLSVAKDLFLV